MSILKNIEVGSIVVIKYPLDESIIGEIIEIDKTTVTLKKPCKVFDTIDGGKKYTIIKLWNRYALDDMTQILLNNVAGISIASKDIVDTRELYLKEQSKLDLLEDNKKIDILNLSHEGNETLH